MPFAGSKALYDAVEVATKQKPKAEKEDVPPGSDISPQKADKQNDTTRDEYYLFGPDRYPIGPDKQPLREGEYKPSASCKDLLTDFEPEDGRREQVRRRTASACRSSRRSGRPARRTARGCSRCRRASWWWRASRPRTSRRACTASS